jgi:hypothetical protein
MAKGDGIATLTGADRVLATLKLLAGHSSGVSLEALSREMGAPKSSTHRALAALRRAGFAEQDERGRYRVGSELVRIAFDYPNESATIDDGRHREPAGWRDGGLPQRRCSGRSNRAPELPGARRGAGQAAGSGMRPVRSALTPRDREVLDLMTTGASTRQFSHELWCRSTRCRATSSTFSESSESSLGSRAEAIARAHGPRCHRRLTVS